MELIHLFARSFLLSKHHLVMFEKGFIFTNLTEAFHTTLKVSVFWSFLFVLPIYIFFSSLVFFM